MLSSARPRPSMLISTPARLRTPVYSSLVNWQPWSELKISGTPFRSASSNASRQNRHASIKSSLSTGRHFCLSAQRRGGMFPSILWMSLKPICAAEFLPTVLVASIARTVVRSVSLHSAAKGGAFAPLAVRDAWLKRPSTCETRSFPVFPFDNLW